MKKNKFISNILYAFIFQIINMAFPIIVSPYITRVLGVTNYGMVNYSLNIANIFVIFVIFGTNIYGVKELSKTNSKKVKEQFIAKVIKLKNILGVLTFLIYMLISFISFSNQILLYFIQGLLILGSIYSLDWIFQSDENYRSIAIRTCIIKAIALLLIFTTVQNENDYKTYAFLYTMSTIISYYFGYIYIKRQFVLPKVKFKECLPLIKPLGIFFLINIISSLYSYIDTVILGSIKDSYSVGLYSLARTTIVSITTVTLTISTCIMPRLNNLFANNKERYKELLKSSYNFLLSLAIPLTFGTISLSTEIVYILGGKSYIGSIILINIMSIIIILNSIWTWNYYQRIIPNNLELKLLKYQIFMTIIMIISNIVIVPYIGEIGAAITFVMCEIIGLIFCKILLKNCNKFSYINKSIIIYLFSSVVMLIIITLTKKYLINNFIILIILGVVIYFLIILLLKEELYYNFYNTFIQKYKEKIKWKKISN